MNICSATTMIRSTKAYCIAIWLLLPKRLLTATAAKTRSSRLTSDQPGAKRYPSERLTMDGVLMSAPPLVLAPVSPMV